MKYIINGRFLSQRITGVQRYAREIVAELDKICDDLDIEIAVPTDVKNSLEYSNIKVTKIGKRSGLFWEQTEFARYVRRQHAISINLCNSAPLRGNKIVTIHDAKVKAHPEFFSWKFRVWYNFLFFNVIRKSQAVITVSEFSKQEIIKYYRCVPEKIQIIYNAWQHYAPISIDSGILNKFSLCEKEYIFALGSLEPNKNLKWILQAARNNPQEIFIIGGGINEKVFSKFDVSLPDNVRLTGYLSDIEAKSLMHFCKAFVFPSFYEGFGIPPMEAMVAGADRVIVSDIPVMHEIFGTSVDYLDPHEGEEFHWDLSFVHESYEQVLQRFSWEKSAARLKSILESVR